MATTRTWVTEERAGRGLPDDYGTILTAHGTSLGTLIEEQSAHTETMLGDWYHPFPDVDGDPFSTPNYIQDAVSYAVQHQVYRILALANETDPDEDPDAVKSWRMYLQHVNALTLDPGTPGRAVIPRETVTGEEVTWGGDPLTADQYKFAPQAGLGFEVISGSVQIANYQNQQDFRAGLSELDNAWLLQRKTSIPDAVEVSYEFTYARERNKKAPRIGNVIRIRRI